MSLIQLNKKIILASGSEIRQATLKQYGINCEIIKPIVDEEEIKKDIKHLSFSEQSIALAEAKGKDIAIQNPEAIVISGDQICEMNGEVLSKPGNHENSIKHLGRLSGQTFCLHGGICIYANGKLAWKHCELVELTMRDLQQEEIESYIKTDEPYFSCGAFKFESYGRHLFSKVNGDFDSVLGMPLIPLLNQLYKLEAIAISSPKAQKC